MTGVLYMYILISRISGYFQYPARYPASKIRYPAGNGERSVTELILQHQNLT
jgi:hypothetical protein